MNQIRSCTNDSGNGWSRGTTRTGGRDGAEMTSVDPEVTSSASAAAVGYSKTDRSGTSTWK